MNANATARFPLDDLLQCGQCGAALRMEAGPEPHYACPGQAARPTACGVPALSARKLNQLLIREITRNVITGANVPRFREQFQEALAGAQGQDQSGGAEPRWEDEDAVRIAAASALWLHHEDGTPAATEILSTFVDRIEVGADKATVAYLIPLPPGAPLAGATRQSVNLPETMLA